MALSCLSRSKSRVFVSHPSTRWTSCLSLNRCGWFSSTPTSKQPCFPLSLPTNSFALFLLSRLFIVPSEMIHSFHFSIISYSLNRMSSKMPSRSQTKKPFAVNYMMRGRERGSWLMACSPSTPITILFLGPSINSSGFLCWPSASPSWRAPTLQLTQ